MSKLNTQVYTIENGRIIECRIADFSGFIEETTTPQGVAPKFHTRGCELWTWGHAGNFPKMVSSYATEEEASAALDDTFIHDFWASSEILAFPSRDAAEKYLETTFD